MKFKINQQNKTMKFLQSLIIVITFFGINSLYSINRIHPPSDSTILSLTQEILTAIKDKDYETFSEYFHPELGVRFSPYGYVDTTSDLIFTKEQFMKQTGKNKKIKWGEFDGSGDPINMTLKQYFKRFVYDVDFLKAEKTSLNQMFGAGNTMENILQVYENCPFTESYFSGFDEKYGGMDWRSLKLVYKKYDDKYYIIGVIHSEWTI